MKFKLIGSGVAALTLLATTWAQAADIPRKAVRSVVAYHNWTGFYLGINGGYGWASTDFTDPALPAATNTRSANGRGWLMGGTVGYNHQVGSMVFGIEGDWDWSNVKASPNCNAFLDTLATCTTTNAWLATFRGRFGYALDRWMPYITGGGAYGNVKFDYVAQSSAAQAHTSSNKLGWTAGAGVEYAFLGNWSTKIEYLYVDLGKVTNGGNVPNTTASFKEHVVRAGLNYKFSGPIFSRF